MDYNLDQIFIKLDAALSEEPNVRLKKCSQSLGVNRQTVEKAVKATTGVSFREYQKQRILLEALRLLAEEGELSETEIAQKLGYQSADAFERFVESETGSKPGDFRSLGVRAEGNLIQAPDKLQRPEFADPAPASSIRVPELDEVRRRRF